ncbi:MAG TPA: hypothetical protein VGG08_00495 [Solirubrobacteraceae bacterium]|jgi:hypothetical protein
MPRSASHNLARAWLLAAVLTLAATLFVPGAAFAAAGSIEGGSSFSELQQKAEEPETETTPTSTSATSESETGEAKNSDKTLLVVLGAAVVLLSGITFVIVRDARRVAPAGEADIGDRRSGADRVVRQQRRRAKAKAAKAQRKRNR